MTSGRITAVLCIVALSNVDGFLTPSRSLPPMTRYVARASPSVCSLRATAASSSESPRPLGAKRLIQHKKEALTFYRFLSIVYDKIVNPGHWTEDMRDEALQPAKLDSPDLDVVDVGAG
jgi:MPBQ/MSBQ methyltransferase